MIRKVGKGSIRRNAIGLALFMAVTMPVSAQDKGKEDEQFYGTWSLTSVDVMGKATPYPIDALTLVIAKGGTVTVKAKAIPETWATFKIDKTKTPPEVDVFNPQDEGKMEKTLKGIYQINADTLKIYFPINGRPGERPTSFDNQIYRVMTYKRNNP